VSLRPCSHFVMPHDIATVLHGASKLYGRTALTAKLEKFGKTTTENKVNDKTFTFVMNTGAIVGVLGVSRFTL
jgi:hypothetical protein